MELPPFNYPNPLGLFGGTKQVHLFFRLSKYYISLILSIYKIRAEAAYLYDAVHLYSRALIKVLESNENPRNGTAIVQFLRGSSYLSAMG